MTREEKREYKRKWYQENKEKILEQKKLYRQENKERLLEQMKLYRQTPMWRASYLLSHYNQNDKKYNRGKGDLSAEWIVSNIFSKPCAHCGKSGWEVIGCNRLDNSKPHSKDNVEPCCKDCNDKLATEEKKTDFAKQVFQYTLDGKLVGIWPSTKECSRNGYDQGNVASCCRGEKGFKTHKGYKWSYAPL